MKKLITVILAIVSIFSFFMLFTEAKISSADNTKNLESRLNNSHRILMPNMLSMADQKYIYGKLTKCLDRYHANIYYSKIEMQNRGGKEIEREIKYVYFNNLDYFKKLRMSSGRSFSLGEKESKLFLSTEKTGKPNQVGRIASINKDSPIEVHTLEQLINNGEFLDGYAYIQLPKGVDINKFIIELQKSLKIGGVKILNNMNYGNYENSLKWVVILGLYFFCMLMLVYDILKAYREISIKKMLGFSKFTIYISKLKRLILTQVVVQLVVTAVLSFVEFDNFNIYVWGFFKNLIGTYAIQLGLLIIAVSIPYVYINKIKISDMLKNKQPTREVLIFNNGIKIILIAAFFMVANLIVKDFSSFKNLYSKSFVKWEETKDYVVLPTLRGFNSNINDYLASDKSLEEQKNIYTYFNERGALLADFSEFTAMTRKIRLGETKYPYESDNAWVNPNYLKLNHIYDENGKVVEVSEKADTEVILVPEKYKKYEKDIIKKHKFWNTGWRESDPKIKRGIKIIWIKNGQSIFTYNLEINTDKGNCLKDVFVNVTTENNGLGYEYSKMVAYTGNPFKIKLDPKISIEENIRPELNKYGYSKYIPNIQRVDSSVKAEGDKIKEKMYIYLGISLLITAALVFILMQNVFTFFNQYKQRIAIRHLHGYSSLQKYKEYITLILSSWIIILVAIRVSGKVNLYIELLLSAVLILFEMILSLIALTFANKKNIISTIKGN